MDSLKRRLLDEMAEKNVHKVYQLDGFATTPGGDGCLDADGAGDVLYSGWSYELRNSGPALAVRVHVHAGTNSKVAVRVLSKILRWLERNPHLIEEEEIRPRELEDARTIAARAGVAVAPEDCARLLRVAQADPLVAAGRWPSENRLS